MPQTMLGAASFLGPADDLRSPVWLVDEPGLALGGDREAEELPLFFGLRVKVLVLELEDRARDQVWVIGIEGGEALCDLSGLCPGERLDRLLAVLGSVWPAHA